MTIRIGTSLVAGALLAGLSGRAVAQMPIASTFDLGVHADANQLDGTSQTDTYSASQGSTLNPFSGSLSVTDNLADGHHVTTTSSASASWASAGQGTVLWRGMGWVHVSANQTAAKLNGFVTGSPVWSYTFQATTDGTISLTYDVRASGDMFGLQGVVIEWSGIGGGQDLTNPFTPVTSGTFTRSLTSGTTYTIGLANMGNIFTSLDPRNDFGSMDADFNWSTGPVPEPMTLTTLGIATLAFFRRRR